MTTAFAVLPMLSSATEAGLAQLFPRSSVQPSPTLPYEQPITTVVQTPSTHESASRQEVSDEALLQEISRGDEWAMEILYERYARYAYALAYRIVHDHSTTEDIVQDVFLSIWRKAASYQVQHGCVRSWLQAIAHHRAIDSIRASTHRDHQSTPLEDMSEPGHSEEHLKEEKPEVWEIVWHEERSALLRSILAQLPKEQRQVIELGYFGGYTHAEIAERWHLPLGTVKGRMRLGLQKMKYLLSQHGIDNAG